VRVSFSSFWIVTVKASIEVQSIERPTWKLVLGLSTLLQPTGYRTLLKSLENIPRRLQPKQQNFEGNMTSLASGH
jgi:hypothetical protein